MKLASAFAPNSNKLLQCIKMNVYLAQLNEMTFQNQSFWNVPLHFKWPLLTLDGHVCSFLLNSKKMCHMKLCSSLLSAVTFVRLQLLPVRVKSALGSMPADAFSEFSEARTRLMQLPRTVTTDPLLMRLLSFRKQRKH